MNFVSVTKRYSQENPSLYTLTVVLQDEKILSVPLDPSNRHYSEIMRQVELGELVIQEAN
jgi:hypothetical protein